MVLGKLSASFTPSSSRGYRHFDLPCNEEEDDETTTTGCATAGEKCLPESYVAPCPSGQKCQAPLAFLKFPSINISGSDIGAAISANEDQCKQACSANAACKAFVWDGGTNCWLKSSVSDPVTQLNRNTYVQVAKSWRKKNNLTPFENAF